MRDVSELDALLAVADTYLSKRVVSYPLTEGERECSKALDAVMRARGLLAAQPDAAEVRKQALAWSWRNVSEELPTCTHECTSSGTEVSDTVLIAGDYPDIGLGHLQDDGKWVCYGGNHDFMHIETVQRWMPIPSRSDATIRELSDKKGGDRG